MKRVGKILISTIFVFSLVFAGPLFAMGKKVEKEKKVTTQEMKQETKAEMHQYMNSKEKKEKEKEE